VIVATRRFPPFHNSPLAPPRSRVCTFSSNPRSKRARFSSAPSVHVFNHEWPLLIVSSALRLNAAVPRVGKSKDTTPRFLWHIHLSWKSPACSQPPPPLRLSFQCCDFFCGRQPQKSPALHKSTVLGEFFFFFDPPGTRLVDKDSKLCAGFFFLSCFDICGLKTKCTPYLSSLRFRPGVVASQDSLVINFGAKAPDLVPDVTRIK